ncbi:P2 phage tail completion R family protein [Escherichia coli p0305293.7]|uniref:phage tail protein n=1 Tax=Escherichia coli TaxID=562 RepID=UPI0002C944C6|nr:phage tail protein [Escherichia coli]ENH53883.1 P2 phage tail completion R family protein [Escherichia coli p0305293.7]
MLKPDSLRRALTDAVTVLKTPNAADIRGYGSIASTWRVVVIRKALHAQCIVTDFTGDFDLLIVPVLAWLREISPTS